MEKLMYLVGLDPTTARDQVRDVMLENIAPQLLKGDVLGLQMDLDDQDADVPAPIPPNEGQTPIHAVVSVWVNAYDFRAPIEAVLESVAVTLDGYQVIESLYGDYGRNPHSESRTWPDGTRSPGILTVALFEQMADTDFEEWITFWHTKQSPMSERVQPRCRYVRNAVFRPITPGAPAYRGIVEEAWPSGNHVIDPMLFYNAHGDKEVMTANITEMIDTVTAFMDLSSTRSLTMSEYIIKTVGAAESNGVG